MAMTDGICAEKCDDCQIRTLNGALDYYYCSRCIKDHSRYDGKCHENKCFTILSKINSDTISYSCSNSEVSSQLVYKINMSIPNAQFQNGCFSNQFFSKNSSGLLI